MPSPEIEEFAKLLVQHVRDAAIKSSDLALRADHVVAQRWKATDRHGDLKSIAAVLIPDIVDDTLFYLLDAIDGGLQISFTAANGKVVNLTKDGLGELAGWYLGDWRSMYSRERYIENFKGEFDNFFDQKKET